MEQPTLTVLLVGKLASVVDDTADQLRAPGVDVVTGTDMDGVRAVLSRGAPDLAILGAGLELQTRLEIVREILSHSHTTSVHLKDAASGREGFEPFARSVINGMTSIPRST